MENEYIYFATNPFYKDDIVKIGWTRNEPKMRAKSLYNTSVPCEFNFEFIIKTPFGQGYNIENKIHNYLKKYRINKKREFFKINKDDLIMILTDELNLEITYELSNNIEEIVEEKQEEIVDEIVEEKQEDLNEYKVKNEEELVYEKQDENKKNKNKFNCISCDFICFNKNDLKRHVKTKKHLINTNQNKSNNICIKNRLIDKNIQNDSSNVTIMKDNYRFSCEICKFNCINKGDWTRHINTKKHKNLMEINKKHIYTNDIYTCNICQKSYQTKAGLWKHNQKCKQYTKNNNTITPEIILKIINNDNEIKNIIMEQITTIIEENKTINNIV